jgi:hypothetical protein
MRDMLVALLMLPLAQTVASAQTTAMPRPEGRIGSGKRPD